MRRAAFRLQLLGVALLALSLSGCRMVWVHPNATAQMYQADILRCKYRMTPADLEQLLADPNLPLPDYRTDWTMVVEIAYANEVSIGYRSSENLDYGTSKNGTPVIHRGYNARVQRLSRRIGTEIMIARAVDSLPPVATPPAGEAQPQ